MFNLDNTEMHAVSASGDRKPYPVLKAPYVQVHGRLSRDGRWIAYASLESGQLEVFVQSFPPSGGKWQISNNHGTEPSWRADGKELYFLSGTKLEAVAVQAAGTSFEAGIPRELFDVPNATTGRRNNYVATADGKRFLFVTMKQNADDATPFILVENWQTALKH
ncbi:MAG: TolB family protein [Bryobacteraceae bacterium]